MLFGPCAQDAAASFLPATSSLCAGGVGFVTAMMAALAANARTAPAKTLGRVVPEVDRLAVRMVTDNVVIQFVPSESRDGLTIERHTRGNLAPDRPPRTAQRRVGSRHVRRVPTR
jgi:7,8-dihydropterin-6-yl-methyl-4-(beta-D-ribofuranosyl)aminobenzene 5'-phosphate synthase